MCHRAAEMEKRATATDDQLAVVGIGDAAGAGAIGVKFDFVGANMKKPGLGVVARRREHSVAKEKLPLVLRGTVMRKILRRDVPGSERRLVRINCSMDGEFWSCCHKFSTAGQKKKAAAAVFMDGANSFIT